MNSPTLRRFGVNYVPSKRWYFCWNDWRLSEIEEDFDALEYDLGLFTTDNRPKPLWGLYKELVRELRHSPAGEAPVFDFGPDFKPVPLGESTAKHWLEENLDTTTWQAFERYLKAALNTSGGIGYFTSAI